MPSIAADTPPRTTASSLRTTRSWHAPTRLTTTTLPPSHERFQPPVASTAVRHWRPEDRDGLGTPDDRIRKRARPGREADRDRRPVLHPRISSTLTTVSASSRHF